MIASESVDDSYPFDVLGSDPWQVDFRPAICAIVGHVKRGVRAGVISARFHNTIAAVIVHLCCRLRQAVHLNQVCLSGGTFQNIYLLTRALAGLRGRGFEVFLHSQVPPNDGGISYANARTSSSEVRFRSVVIALLGHCPSGGTFPSVCRFGAHGESLGSPELHPQR